MLRVGGKSVSRQTWQMVDFLSHHDLYPSYVIGSEIVDFSMADNVHFLMSV